MTIFQEAKWRVCPFIYFDGGTFRTLPPPPSPASAATGLMTDGPAAAGACGYGAMMAPQAAGDRLLPFRPAAGVPTNYRRPSSVTTEHRPSLANQRSGDGVGGRSSVSHKQRAGSLIQSGSDRAQSDKVRHSPEPLPQSNRTAVISRGNKSTKSSTPLRCRGKSPMLHRGTRGCMSMQPDPAPGQVAPFKNIVQRGHRELLFHATIMRVPNVSFEREKRSFSVLLFILT